MPNAALSLTSPPDDTQERDFLAAWKEAATLTGTPSLFGAHSEKEINSAGRKEALTPRIKPIEQSILQRPGSQAALIAAMVSFYNPAEGAKLAGKLGLASFADLAKALWPRQREVVAQLIVNYEGW